MVGKTIFASLSNTQKSPICIFRISGPKVKNIIKNLCNYKIKPHKVNLAKIKKKDGSLLDQAIVLYFKKPKSLTGEDLVEFHLHGSPSIIKEFQEILLTYKGVYVAEPGEFSKQAFDNNKMDLIQIEGLDDLYNSFTEKQRIQAQNAFLGGVSSELNSWRDSIINLNALIESNIDFSDEDLPKDILKNFYDLLMSLKKDIVKQLKNSEKAKIIKEGLKVSVVGPPNAGKSSLINVITKKNVSIVDSNEGTTRDIVGTSLEINGNLVNFYDTAGLKVTDNKVESEGIKRAIELAKISEIQISMVDVSVDEWKKELNNVPKLGILNINVANKIDLVKNENLDDENTLFISTKTETGISNLLKKINICVENITNTFIPPTLLRHRHIIAANNIKDCLERIERIDINKNPELIAEDLRKSLFEIRRVTGLVDIENILDSIFSNFCIGK